ncbi:MAG TPA: ferredoxin family protein [Tepidisphaeraceae bacterium]|nr:ferredoxin family protein [Tepidisphaeraceae bacterium]
MAYVICAPCVGKKDASCVAVCPTDAIHPRPDEGGFPGSSQLYIDPARCSDCGNCMPECPVEAIFPAGSVPAEWQQYIQINADYFK